MDKKIVALLPMKARSTRVKGKNFRNFCGKPLFRWILDSLKLNTSVLLGVKRPSDVTSALGAFDWELSKEHLDMLNSISKKDQITT